MSKPLTSGGGCQLPTTDLPHALNLKICNYLVCIFILFFCLDNRATIQDRHWFDTLERLGRGAVRGIP